VHDACGCNSGAVACTMLVGATVACTMLVGATVAQWRPQMLKNKNKYNARTHAQVHACKRCSNANLPDT